MVETITAPAAHPLRRLYGSSSSVNSGLTGRPTLACDDLRVPGRHLEGHADLLGLGEDQLWLGQKCRWVLSSVMPQPSCPMSRSSSVVPN